MNSKEAKESEVGDNLELRIASSKEIDAEIVHIVEENQKELLFFKTNQYLPETN